MNHFLQVLLLSLTLLPMQSFAKGIACQPNPHDTQMMISWNEKEIILKVINPMGYSYMPQMETVGQSSIPFLKMQSDDLKGLGDSYEYHWPREKCTIGSPDEWLISCQGSVNAVDQKNKIPSLGFTTSRLDETTLNGKQSTFRARMIFDQSNIYFVTLPIATEFCSRF